MTPTPYQLFDSHILPTGGHRFTGAAFREMCGPQVYMFLLNGEALYVGMSRQGLSRAAQRDHKQAEQARAICDEVLLWPTRGEGHALALERMLIYSLKPKMNQRQKPRPQREAIMRGLGVTDQRAKVYAADIPRPNLSAFMDRLRELLPGPMPAPAPPGDEAEALLGLSGGRSLPWLLRQRDEDAIKDEAFL